MIFGVLSSWHGLPLAARFFILFFLFLLFLGVINLFYERKIEKLKYGGTGILKQTKISEIREKYCESDDNPSGYYVYRLETKDNDGNVYESGMLFNDADYRGHTTEEMKKEYDGVIYDFSDKYKVIKQLNNKIQHLEMELQGNPGFLKKRKLKKDIEVMKKYLEIAKEGSIVHDTYLIVNGHKISEGDSINVYINPNNPKEYYFDLDFTKDKYLK